MECLALKRALISALHHGLPQVGSSSDPFQVPGHNTICEEDCLTPKTSRLKFASTLCVRFVIPGKENFIYRHQPLIDQNNLTHEPTVYFMTCCVGIESSYSELSLIKKNILMRFLES